MSELTNEEKSAVAMKLAIKRDELTAQLAEAQIEWDNAEQAAAAARERYRGIESEITATDQAVAMIEPDKPGKPDELPPEKPNADNFSGGSGPPPPPPPPPAPGFDP